MSFYLVGSAGPADAEGDREGSGASLNDMRAIPAGEGPHPTNAAQTGIRMSMNISVIAYLL